MAENLRARVGLTAVGVGVSSGDDTRLAVAGTRRHRGDVPVAVDDLWHLGSIGKSLTATMIASLFEDEYPKLDARLVDLLPDQNLHEWWKDCTLYHLLTSTSGLPRDFPMRRLIGKQEQDASKVPEIRAEYVTQVLSKPCKHQSGQRFHYSNLGYSVLGYIAEHTTGSDYESLIRKHVLNPMGLSSAGFGAPQGENEDSQPMGHRRLLGYRKVLDPFKGVADLPPFMAPAGRVHMNLADLLDYGHGHLGTHPGHSILRDDTWSLLHRPYLDEYGCGWVAQNQDLAGDTQVIWHNGSNGGWYALIVLVPSSQTVLAFVTNDGAIRRADQAFAAAAKELYLSL